jgi:hypothetical protein
VCQVTNFLFGWLDSALSYMPMANYPYPANFLGPMPAWPCAVACSYFAAGQVCAFVVTFNHPLPLLCVHFTRFACFPQSDLQIMESLALAVGVFYNYTGWAGECYNLGNIGPSTLGDAGGWDYQSCTGKIHVFISC